MGQRGRTKGLGEAAQVRAEEAKPLCKSILVSRCTRDRRDGACRGRGRETYTNQKSGKGSGDDQHEENREDFVRVLGFLAEDVVNPGLFAVAHGGGDDGRGCVRILLDINVEDIGNDTLR